MTWRVPHSSISEYYTGPFFGIFIQNKLFCIFKRTKCSFPCNLNIYNFYNALSIFLPFPIGAIFTLSIMIMIIYMCHPRHIIHRLYDRFTWWQQQRRLNKRNNPWISPDIVKLMYHRDFLHKKAVSSKYQSLWKEYQRAWNTVNSAITCAKKSYYDMP